MASQPAVSRVLGTFELLEHILKDVDCKTLLTSVRRVSTTWKTMVDASLPLQWRTWHWRSSELPRDFQRPSDFCPFPSNRFGYEFSSFILPWLRTFWLKLLEKIDSQDEEDEIWNSLADGLPQTELFRPCLKISGDQEIKMQIELVQINPLDKVNLSQGVYTVHVPKDQLQLRNLGRQIVATGFSKDGSGWAQKVRWLEQDSHNTLNRRLGVSMIFKLAGPAKRTIRLIFKFRLTEWDKSVITVVPEYWMTDSSGQPQLYWDLLSSDDEGLKRAVHSVS
ncbi:hypothetical protein ABW20_dc0110588 [Dactylellina cionopaga]|nr:hypothetical protein ABW20_dc0110588 [Dactylellina cionopaga]